MSSSQVLSMFGLIDSTSGVRVFRNRDRCSVRASLLPSRRSKFFLGMISSGASESGAIRFVVFPTLELQYNLRTNTHMDTKGGIGKGHQSWRGGIYFSRSRCYRVGWGVSIRFPLCRAWSIRFIERWSESRAYYNAWEASSHWEFLKQL